MTPFSKGKQILTYIEDLADNDPDFELPNSRYVTLSEPVVDCERLIIALTSIVPMEEIDPHCGPIQIGTFIIVIARACANVSDQHGETVPSEAERVGEVQSTDGEFLWNFASSYPGFAQKEWDLGFAITGGLSITSLTLMTGID